MTTKAMFQRMWRFMRLRPAPQELPRAEVLEGVTVRTRLVNTPDPPKEQVEIAVSIPLLGTTLELKRRVTRDDPHLVAVLVYDLQSHIRDTFNVYLEGPSVEDLRNLIRAQLTQDGTAPPDMQ